MPAGIAVAFDTNPTHLNLLELNFSHTSIFIDLGPMTHNLSNLLLPASRL